MVFGLVFWVFGLAFLVFGLVFWVFGFIFLVFGFIFWVPGDGRDGRAGGRVGRVQSMGKNPIWELVPGKMNMVALEIRPTQTFFENGSPGQTTMLMRFVSKF